MGYRDYEPTYYVPLLSADVIVFNGAIQSWAVHLVGVGDQATGFRFRV